jgi:hypothetical protein
MTRSIFDPTSGDMRDEGGRYQTPPGQNASLMPTELTDGAVERDEKGRVPFKGSKESGLSPRDTERLVEAAEHTRDEENRPDDSKKDGLYPGESPDQEGTISMQDA